jgi:hypothetical protein
MNEYGFENLKVYKLAREYRRKTHNLAYKLHKNSLTQANVGTVKLPSATCFLPHHPPPKARCQASPKALPRVACYEIIDESGFGGWVDETVKVARAAAAHVLRAGLGDNATEFTYSHLIVSRKQARPQHLAISCYGPGALRADEE